MNSTDDTLPKISVIIATYNRAFMLKHCLQSIIEQSVSQDIFEVIVIDNNSKDNTHNTALSFKGKIKNFKLVNEPIQGLSYARNTGVSLARGSWIASLDDDAKAHKNWIEIILREINKGSFDVFGGPYLAWHHYGPPPVWFSEDWETNVQHYSSYADISNELGNSPTGGNCVFKKDTILRMNGFPTTLGMKGEKCAYGEETKLFEDMRSAGFKLGAVPDLLIDHCVLPYKYTLKWRLKATFAQGLASPHVKQEKFHKYLLEFIKQILLLPKRLWLGYQHKHFWQRIFLDSASPILSNLGRVVSCTQILLQKALSNCRW